MAKMITGNDHIASRDNRPVYKEYWYSQYPLTALVHLQEVLETTMIRETVEKVQQPVLMLYYYKDSVHQESVVSVPAMLKMFKELGSATKLKQAIRGAGDHVIGSYVKSEDLAQVQRAIERFMQQTLKLKKVKDLPVDHNIQLRH